MQVRDQDFVDLRWLVAGRAQMIEQLAGRRCQRAPGAGVDQHALVAGVDQKTVDRRRHRVGIAGLAEQAFDDARLVRSEEHTSELQSLMRISYAVFCLKKKKKTILQTTKKIASNDDSSKHIS